MLPALDKLCTRDLAWRYQPFDGGAELRAGQGSVAAGVHVLETQAQHQPQRGPGQLQSSAVAGCLHCRTPPPLVLTFEACALRCKAGEGHLHLPGSRCKRPTPTTRALLYACLPPHIVERQELRGHVLVVDEALDEAHDERLQRVRHVGLALLLVDALEVGLLLGPHGVRHEVVLPAERAGRLYVLPGHRAAAALGRCSRGGDAELSAKVLTPRSASGKPSIGRAAIRQPSLR